MKSFCFILVFVILISFVSSYSVSLEVPQEFNFGEEIYFEYNITGMESVRYAPSIVCEDYFLPLLDFKEVQLTLVNPISERYILGVVDGETSSQSCLAILDFDDPEDRSYSKSFLINNVIPAPEIYSAPENKEESYKKLSSENISVLNIETSETPFFKSNKMGMLLLISFIVCLLILAITLLLKRLRKNRRGKSLNRINSFVLN